MSVACINCSHCDLRSNPDMSRHGFVLCRAKSENKAHYRSVQIEHECDKYESDQKAAIVKRKKYLDTVGLRFKNLIMQSDRTAGDGAPKVQDNHK